MKSSPAQAVLVGQQQALDAYFDALFQCETATPASDAAPVAEPPAKQPPDAAVAETKPAERSPDNDACKLAGNQEIQAPDAGRIRVQIFTVAGLTLAVPLERLQAVVENVADTVVLSERRGLIAGTLAGDGDPTWVVDTARLVLPEERAAKLPSNAADRCRHLLIIDDGRWALGCNEITDVVALAEADITWRTAAGKRPWLAGMAAQHRCALLDADGLLRLLDDSLA